MTGEELRKRLGVRIRQLREAKGLRQEDMADFDVKYFQRIEYGQKNVTLRTLIKLANALDVSVRDLFEF